jgi:probable DNA metabolism protein
VDAHLASPTDIAGFRMEAQQLLAHQVPPEDVVWKMPSAAEDRTFSVSSIDPLARAFPRAASAIVPASFVRLCEFVVQHRDADRYELLYRLLWRLVHEPHLRHDNTDADMARAQHMAHAVRRDIHKLKSHARFRELRDGKGVVHIAYCEPAHHIIDVAAPFFARRFAGQRWALLSHERSVGSGGKGLRLGGGLATNLTMAMPDEQWIAAWQSVLGDHA